MPGRDGIGVRWEVPAGTIDDGLMRRVEFQKSTLMVDQDKDMGQRVDELHEGVEPRHGLTGFDPRDAGTWKPGDRGKLALIQPAVTTHRAQQHARVRRPRGAPPALGQPLHAGLPPPAGRILHAGQDVASDVAAAGLRGGLWITASGAPDRCLLDA